MYASDTWVHTTWSQNTINDQYSTQANIFVHADLREGQEQSTKSAYQK